MKVVYMGTPDFAVPTLEALYDAGHEICYVVTQPDAERDRGRKIKFSPVKEKAIEYKIPILQPERIKGNDEFIKKIREANPDVIVVAAYGQLLPGNVLDIPKYGCLNVHGSLLPKYRGAAPIQRAILEGEEETGVTIMYMAEGLDTGDMLLKGKTSIGSKNASQLHDELAVMGAELIVETLNGIEKIEGVPQDDSLHTYAPMINKKDGEMDFSRTAVELERVIRAFNPWPGAYTYCGEKMIKIWRAEVLKESSSEKPGCVIKTENDGIYISSGDGILKVIEIQAQGKKKMPVKEYLRGNSIEIGTILG